MKILIKLSDGTAWPNPLDGAGAGVENRLRYGPTQRSDQLIAAGVMAAWRHLVMDCSGRRQTEVLRELKRLALAELETCRESNGGVSP